MDGCQRRPACPRHHPSSLTWANGKGLTFSREISVDEKFLFTVTDSVKNDSAPPTATLHPYGLIARHGLPVMQSIFVVHEGMVRSADGQLEETATRTSSSL
jgi:YidC/Oxa1 family membrane protein insertase